MSSRTPAEDRETRERTAELFSRLPDDASAREELVHLYQPLAEYLARKFAGRGEAVEDLIQVASIGLLNAVDRFDMSREVQFPTYAAVTIVGELKRHFRDKGWSVRVPRRLQEVGLRVNRVLGELWQELGRSPTVAEIAKKLELPEEQILEAMEAMQAYSTTSLDAPIGEDGLTHGDMLPQDDDSLELLEAWASVGPTLRELPRRERRILYLRFFKGLTQTEIADQLGISQMHVSRLLSQTLAQLRGAIEEPS
ncbi:MAG TPA: SigB/SigF/SigG family RNA polymerase sigma factor [Actinomycetota bacterium]|nr:SigB/SigF/SigG family RNA polymerase sigma factor [Actinomycetota bacterium]